jgi:GMP synthase-like glutamine amidotransferase
MNIHCLTHVPFEDAANIQVWADRHGHTLRYTHLYKNDPLPAMNEFDMLAIMGGPMNVYEYDAYPWLKMEKHFIRRAIDARKKVLGVCLGGQLIADTLGGKVTKNKLPEIGWHTISLRQAGKKSPLFEGFDEEFMVFHWHGDTFAIPPMAVHLAGSKACDNQVFLYNTNVLGLQCHLEYSETSIRAMLKDCESELIQSPYVQNIRQIEHGLKWVSTVQGYMDTLLDRFVNLK